MCNSRKSSTFKVLKIKVIHTASMCKNTTNNSVEQQKTLFSLPEPVLGKKIKVDFNAPDMSSNGGLLLARSSKDSLPSKMGRLIPDDRTQCLVRHSYEEMVCQRVNQILCGYEDANDCDRLRCDSALKMSVGRRPSDEGLCSQATMTRLENNVDSKTLYRIGKLFVEQYVKSFSKPPRHVILDADDTKWSARGFFPPRAVPDFRRGLVRRVPRCGTGSTTPWYREYHTVVLRVPHRGIPTNRKYKNNTE